MYKGDDWRLLPTIASVVHALADRKTLTVPEWVWGHKAPEEWVVFCDPPGSYFWRLEKPKAPSTCLHHRVYFNPRLLDKGTPDWWLPWNYTDTPSSCSSKRLISNWKPSPPGGMT